jgi:hypothetical protein
MRAPTGEVVRHMFWRPINALPLGTWVRRVGAQGRENRATRWRPSSSQERCSRPSLTSTRTCATPTPTSAPRGPMGFADDVDLFGDGKRLLDNIVKYKDKDNVTASSWKESLRPSGPISWQAHSPRSRCTWKRANRHDNIRDALCRELRRFPEVQATIEPRVENPHGGGGPTAGGHQGAQGRHDVDTGRGRGVPWHEAARQRWG